MRIGTTCLLAIALLCACATGFAPTAQDKPKAENTASADDGDTGDKDADDKKEEPVRTLKVNEVARINTRIITAEEFIQRLCQREKVYSDPDLRSASWALDSLIIDELLIQEAERIAAVPKRRWTNEEYDKLMAAFDEKLQQVNKAVVEAGSDPYKKEEFVRLKYDMSMQEFETYLQSVARDNIIRRQVVNYWKLTTDCADAEGVFKRNLKNAKDVQKRLVAGARLEAVAPSESEDMHTRQSAGVIGTAYRGDGSFSPEVDEVFWKLKVGEWSQPIKVETGYWVVRKAKFFPRNEAPFFQLQDQCLQKMPNPSDELMLKWRHAVASSGLYTYERRMPGWDCQAGED